LDAGSQGNTKANAPTSAIGRSRAIKDIFDIVAVPHFQETLWRASGYVDVYSEESRASFQCHWVEGEKIKDSYLQSHIERHAWSRDPQRAIAKVKKKLCLVKSKDDAYFDAKEAREERKIFVEWNPDEECPF
jgi:hypothetical protein